MEYNVTTRRSDRIPRLVVWQAVRNNHVRSLVRCTYTLHFLSTHPCADGPAFRSRCWRRSWKSGTSCRISRMNPRRAAFGRGHWQPKGGTTHATALPPCGGGSDAACGPETGLGHWAHHAQCRLRREPAQAQAGQGDLRLDENHERLPTQPQQRPVTHGPVRLSDGRGLQLAAHRKHPGRAGQGARAGGEKDRAAARPDAPIGSLDGCRKGPRRPLRPGFRL